MEYSIVHLNDEQVNDIEDRLSEYDKKHIKYKITGNISIGILSNGKVIGGADGSMTAFKIFYLSTVYVDADYRGKGIGKKLLAAIEEEARALGANMIRLDTFDWQGADFYKKLGYEQVGMYESEIDGFSEFFFLKRL